MCTENIRHGNIAIAGTPAMANAYSLPEESEDNAKMGRKRNNQRKSRGRKRPTPKLRMAGDPLLATVCHPIYDQKEIEKISRELTFLATNNDKCVGIAANQIGYDKRVMVIMTGEKQYLTAVNPTIKNVTDEMSSMTEGCLSYPGRRVKIKRPIGIIVDYQDIYGNTITDAEFTDFVARIFCHEYDHLNGKCLVGALR